MRVQRLSLLVLLLRGASSWEKHGARARGNRANWSSIVGVRGRGPCWRGLAGPGRPPPRGAGRRRGAQPGGEEALGPPGLDRHLKRTAGTTRSTGTSSRKACTRCASAVSLSHGVDVSGACSACSPSHRGRAAQGRRAGEAIHRLAIQVISGLIRPHTHTHTHSRPASEVTPPGS